MRSDHGQNQLTRCHREQRPKPYLRSPAMQQAGEPVAADYALQQQLGMEGLLCGRQRLVRWW